jgi:cytochrome c553
LGFFLVAVTIFAVARPSAAASVVEGSQLAAACASCHRPDGRGTGIPTIAGLDEDRIVKLMLAYRLESHGNQIMHVVASALSPEEIAAIAHYLARQQVSAGR